MQAFPLEWCEGPGKPAQYQFTRNGNRRQLEREEIEGQEEREEIEDIEDREEIEERKCMEDIEDREEIKEQEQEDWDGITDSVRKAI